tara:strand:- start:7182 stop:7541 length:360 start_codon:yes stop_codon:yes gene_type:complete
MTSTDFELKEKEGTLWVDGENELIARGKVKLNGLDVYCGLLKSKNRDGDEKIELMFSAGLIHFNSPDTKLDPIKSPDWSGKVTLAGSKHKASIWKNSSANGKEYLSVRLKEADENPPPF